MKQLSLISKSNPRLHQRSDSVCLHSDVRPLVEEMWRIIRLFDGFGLAAPQLGVMQRVIVIRTKSFKQVFINPVIVKSNGGTVTSSEGCLSYLGLTVPVIRHRKIIIEGYDENWEPIRRKLKGIQSYCAQHEVDHLEGITISN